MKLDLKAIEERCEKAEQDTMHTMRLLAFHQNDIPALLAFAKEAKAALEKFPSAEKIEDAAMKWSAFAPGRKAQHFYEGALFARNNMINAREVLKKWFGEEGEK